MNEKSIEDCALVLAMLIRLTIDTNAKLFTAVKILDDIAPGTTEAVTTRISDLREKMRTNLIGALRGVGEKSDLIEMIVGGLSSTDEPDEWLLN